MCTMQNSNSNYDKHNPVLYTRRWLFLSLICGLQACNWFAITGFGMLSDVYQDYYKVAGSQGDMLYVAPMLGTFLSFPFLAVVVASQWAALRVLLLLACYCMLTSYAIIVTSSFYREIFAAVVLGQVLQGISQGILLSMVSAFAITWFPTHQVGTALGFNLASVPLGVITASLLPPLLYRTIADSTRDSIGFSAIAVDSIVDSNSTTNGSTFYDISDTTITMQCMYIPILALVAVTTLLFALFLTDVPPTPPTATQNAKRNAITVPVGFRDGVRRFLKETLFLFSDRVFILSTIVLSACWHLNSWEFTLLNEVIATYDVTTAMNQSVLAGALLSTFELGFSIGSVLAGLLMNCYKNFILQTRVALTVALAANVAFVLGFYFPPAPLIFGGHFVLGLSVAVATATLYEVISQHSYPCDELFVNVWLTGVQTFLVVPITEFARLIFARYSSRGVLGYQSALLASVFVLSFLVAPSNNRLSSDQKREDDEEKQAPNERTYLLESSSQKSDFISLNGGDS